MCDNCKLPPDIFEMLDVDEDDEEDPVVVAQRRLRCYYLCVTKDIGGSHDMTVDETPFSWDDDDELGLPRY